MITFSKMTTNPYIEGYLETLGEKEDMLRRAHKLIIYGIYQWDKPIHEEIFDPVRIYCKEKNITFHLREFDPEHKEEDREIIIKLPAFNLHKEGEYVLTFYPHDNYKGIIRDQVRIPCIPTNSWSLPTFKFPALTRKKRIAPFSSEP